MSKLQATVLSTARAITSLSLLALAACGPAPDPNVVPVGGRPEPTKAAPAPVGDDALAERYLAAKERYAALLPEDKAGPGRVLTELGPGLREAADAAKDVHLRANASLLLGRLYEDSGDARSAISFYRQTAGLLPAEAAPRRVLAMALAADKQFAAALPEMQKVVEDDPDDLEAWLMLGELSVKAEKPEDATRAYAAYEMRRKGLIDGLTLKSPEGVFTIPPDQRAGCARALIPARDNGTAIALIYALEIETDPTVRQAIVEAMGTQRLAGYKTALEARLKAETAQEVKEAIVWALAEIQRDPLDVRPGPAPTPAPDDKAEGTGPKGQDDKAEGTGPKGQDAKAAGTGPDGKAAATGEPAAGTQPGP
jgi:tetratricopeptide (TPR) repeat protein